MLRILFRVFGYQCVEIDTQRNVILQSTPYTRAFRLVSTRCAAKQRDTDNHNGGDDEENRELPVVQEAHDERSRYVLANRLSG